MRRPKATKKAENAAEVLAERDPEDVARDERVGAVIRLLANGATVRGIQNAMRSHYGIGPDATDRLIRLAHIAVKAEVEERRPYARAEQITRLREALQKTYGAKEFKPSQVARLESLLADLEGNREPIKVAVAIALPEAMAKVVQGMTQERFEALANAARERRRLAAKAAE